MPDGDGSWQPETWPRVVTFDTSGPFLSLGWACEGASGGRIIDMARGQAEALMPALEELLAERGWSWTALDCIGVGIGPGNFTGIRIAVSAARGLGLARGIPVFGISGFQAAHGWHSPPPGTLVSLPAPQDMAYVQGFGLGDDEVRQGMMIDPAAPPPGLQLSPDAKVQGHRAAEIAAPSGALAQDLPARPDPARMAAMTEDLYRRAAAFPPRPAPFYVKQPDAAPGRDRPPKILA